LKTDGSELLEKDTARGPNIMAKARAKALSEIVVSVTVVTYNSGRFIRRCLESALAQTGVRVEVLVVDNASTDGTTDILETFEDRCHIVYNQENTGFAAAQNQAITLSTGDWVLTLNPDVLLMPGFLATLTEAGEAHSEVGAVCGKLLNFKANFEIPDQPRIDSTGIFFNPMLRHLDRGSQEVDTGQYGKVEYVFGATAAAALYRRSMINDVAITVDDRPGEFFDADFFVYREDADVAWRAQLLGWKCLYTPAALGYHVRTVLPGNRTSLNPDINMHSVKNRFLMRIKNMTPGVYRKCLLATTARDLTVIAGCVLFEQTSLRGLGFVVRHWGNFRAKRGAIMARRRVTDDYMARWFSFEPASAPARTATTAALTAQPRRP
jgi:GT2 family glycosyltransferase